MTHQDTHQDTHQLRRALDPIFTPRSVALIGATEKPGSVGRTILQNLTGANFSGPIYPVNPKRETVLGFKAYPSLTSIGKPVDLVVIVTPATNVPALIAESVACGVPGAIIISAGFKETGPEGVELERQVREAAAGKIRIIGPNCLGVMNPLTGLNATFASTIARPGNVGFISQSGALCTAILDWSLRENVGFSAFVSTGSMLDIGWGDLIYHLGDDPKTESIVIYMESVGDARSFMSAAREIALSKPIIVIKAGRTQAAAKAAASHTGALAGSNDVLDAAFRRCGVLRVNNISELFALAATLAKQPRPRGPRLTVLTNAGGPGVLATDALISAGGTLSELSTQTSAQLNAILPSHWSHSNPVDVLGDADPERYVKAFEIAACDENSDGTLVILTPQAMTNPTGFAERMAGAKRPAGKPVLASWMGGDDVAPGIELLNRAGIPTFSYPDEAAEAFAYMWQYSANLQRLYETPELSADDPAAASPLPQVESLLTSARRDGRTLLTEVESKHLLQAYGLPVVATHLARTVDEAVTFADSLRYPVVLKLYSHTITHKTDVGGVQLNLASSEDVRRAFALIEHNVATHAGREHFQGVTVQRMEKLEGYEIILGSSIDPQFGPVLLFGLGGQLVEVFKDRALALPPLTTTLARQMMERTKIFTALQGVRGRKAVDLAKLERILVRFSQLVAEQPRIKELDINPLLVSPDNIVALDARVVLHDWAVNDAALPRTAIRPYPRKYVSEFKTSNGIAVTVRPIRPEDEPLIVQFHETLSEQTVRLRYLHNLKFDERVAHQRLMRICFIDYDRELSLVAEVKDAAGQARIVGVGRLNKLHGGNAAHIYLVISDAFQGKGIGRELTTRMLQAARDEKVQTVFAELLPDAAGMQKLCRTFGFSIAPAQSGGNLYAELAL